MADEKKTILLIDVSSIFWPAAMSTASDMPVNAPHDITVSRVRRLAADLCEARSGCAVCADASVNWRKQKYAPYKAQRAQRPEWMHAQMSQALDTLRRDGFPVWHVEGYEADDLLASATMQALELGHEVVIATGDKDMLQLLGDGVRIYSVAAKNGDDPWRGVEYVREKYGVDPRQMTEWLAIVGDASDNVPGIKGIGAKGATDLLKKYGDLEMVISAAKAGDPEMSPKLREKIVDGADGVRLSRLLISLKTDASIDIKEALAERVTKPLRAQQDETWEENDMFNEDEADNDGGGSNGAAHDDASSGSAANGATGGPGVASAGAQQEQRQGPQAETRYADPPKPEVDPIDRLSQFLPKPGTDEWAAALEPPNVTGAWKIAQKFFDSRLFGFQNIEQCFAAIMLGRSLGLGAMTICRNVHIIKGKLALHATLITGLVLKSSKCEYFTCVETTNEKAVYETKRRGDPKPVRLTYSVEDAKLTGALRQSDSAWQKTPRTMLRHRCATELARMVYGDIISGVYAPEELVDNYEDLPMGARAA
jgi:5'-3' exonuclease